jgi:flavin-dependent dehydrogenase
LERVEQDGGSVRVYFSGDRIEQADILIGGDGVRSSVRGQMAPQVQPIYAGYYIWRGAPNEADLDPETLRTIYPLFTFYLPKQQQVIPSRSPASMTTSRWGSAASISSGTASPTHRGCAR